MPRVRKLASIQTVGAVEPIEGADAIERVRVLGWWVVTKKGEYRPGDKVVYCEIDSLLPAIPEFEFLRKSCYRGPIVANGQELLRGGFRIKTARLRGQVSQGICFPLSILPQGAPTDEGADVTLALDIIKFDPPLPSSLAGRVKGPFPSFVPKTDETRVQVLESVLARHRGKTFYVTEKLDGASVTAYIHSGEYGLCSRNQRLDESDLDNGICRLAKELELESLLQAAKRRLGFEPAIQGEMLGPGIQKNKYALREARLYFFNVLNLDAYRLEGHKEMLEVLSSMGLDVVPQLGTITLDHSVDDLVNLSIGDSALNPKTAREGIVLRPLVDESDPEMGRLSFKAINPKFLLKYDE
jgi:RNA ligase (TIGR02306 family)